MTEEKTSLSSLQTAVDNIAKDVAAVKKTVEEERRANEERRAPKIGQIALVAGALVSLIVGLWAFAIKPTDIKLDTLTGLIIGNQSQLNILQSKDAANQQKNIEIETQMIASSIQTYGRAHEQDTLLRILWRENKGYDLPPAMPYIPFAEWGKTGQARQAQ